MLSKRNKTQLSLNVLSVGKEMGEGPDATQEGFLRVRPSLLIPRVGYALQQHVFVDEAIARVEVFEVEGSQMPHFCFGQNRCKCLVVHWPGRGLPFSKPQVPCQQSHWRSALIR